MAGEWSVLITCEHGGNDVPWEFRGLFRGHEALLESHRGWDPGTLHLAARMSAALGAALYPSTVTRLLVDLNRSPDNPEVFSEVTGPLPQAERTGLLHRFHRPHWDAVRGAIARGVRERGCVLHFGVHSFTPVLNGERRRADVAFLYDPARDEERRLAEVWVSSLGVLLPEHAVLHNDPYRGDSDGLTTAMRREFGESQYLGFEIEVNQRHVGLDGQFDTVVSEMLLGIIAEVMT